MQNAATVFMILIPAIFVLIIGEAIYAYLRGNFNFRTMDSISSLSAGMTNAIKGVLGLTAVIVGYAHMYEYVAVVDTQTSWVTYLLALLGLDFATYWYHRLAHHVNIFWNRHVIHHSGEEFNMATALRQSISKFVNISVFFLLPAAVLGVPPQVIAIVTPFHLYVQVWYHTIHIGKMGWLEYIIVTPSQHRVHHAVNDIYKDKNLAPVFCVWDRLFGTYQEELEEEPCVYGITRQVNTWNPIKINLSHLWLLIQDAWRADSWWDKFRIWFMPTGWRPADVKQRYPDTSVDPYNFKKYDTPASAQLKMWSWFQFTMLLCFLFQLLYQIAEIGVPEVFFYGAFMYFMVYAYTSLMDGDAIALWLELAKAIMGYLIMWHMGSWFHVDQLIYGASYIIAIYLVMSVLVVAYFVYAEISYKPMDAAMG